MKKILFASAVVLVISACGSNGLECGEGTVEEDGQCVSIASNLFATRCSLLCDTSETDYCTADDESDCLTDCNARTLSLSNACGTCILDNSYGFRDGYDEEDNYYSCREYGLPPISDSECSSFCENG